MSKDAEGKFSKSIKGTSLEALYDYTDTLEEDSSEIKIPLQKKDEGEHVGEISENLREHEQAMILPHPRGSVTIKHLETRVRELLEAQLETDTGTSLYVTKNTLDSAPTMVSGYNYLLVGPITISDGVTLDIPDGVVLVIV